MLTSVSYITENYNSQIWEIGDQSGQIFEEYVHEIIANELSQYYRDNLRIIKTTQTRDDGIDIYIESPVEFSLMGIKFSLNGKDKIKVIIECKSTIHNKIVLDKFAKNILINNDLDIDYFILVTNGTIVPSAYHKCITELEKNNGKFLLFDQYFLLQFLSNSKYDVLGNVKYFPHEQPLQLQYQLRKGRIDGRNCFELFLDVKNYSDTPTNITLNLISNRNWNIEEKLREKLVPAHQGICLKFLVKRIYNDGIDDFKVNISYNNQSQLLNIKNPEVVPDFQPPLTGSLHKRLKNEIYNELLSASFSKTMYIYGVAGIGKTRIIDEVVKQIYDTNYIITHILCNIRNKNTLKEILYKQLKIKVTDTSSWKDIVDYFKKNKFYKYLIVIEDLHNATDEFYKEIKELKACIEKFPCSFIIAGREDETVFNEMFFSFASWLKNNALKYAVEKLEEKECESFIKSVIKDVPPIVLDKLVGVSNGNPFYIIQFIEYLLEINFATLLNRNTVGMTNVNTFSVQKYMPKEIEKLIQKRQQGLLLLENGDKYITFLKILCLFGISAPADIIDEFCGSESSQLILPLFQKHYLTYDDNGNVQFDHETLFIFFNKELKKPSNIVQISKLILEQYEGIFYYLPDFQKAKVLFYAKRYEKAEIYFAPIIEDIEDIQNISSANLDRGYFEYLDEIYNLAKRKKRIDLQEKIVQASVYIPMHNMDYGTTVASIQNAILKIDKNHGDNFKLKNAILQLRAHNEITAAKLKKAEQYLLELLAEERNNSNDFSEQSRFDLFDRTASLYTRYNHKVLAETYNDLSTSIAYQLNDPKLICLSTMMKAKIHYYSDTACSVQYMEQAKDIMKRDSAYRINCHNNVSLIGAHILLSAKQTTLYSEYIEDVKGLLAESIDNNYSFTIIRCNLLLASLYYLSDNKNSLKISKKYIHDGINASIRYGCEKLMNYFYNLKALISMKEGYSPEITLQYFDTMLDYLIKQNLLFLGNLDFCYGNVVSLTNYAKFIYHYGDEQRLYRFLNKISYYQSNQTCDFECSKRRNCYYSCNKNIDVFRKNIENIEEKKLILLDSKYQYPLYDPQTGFYVIIH